MNRHDRRVRTSIDKKFRNIGTNCGAYAIDRWMTTNGFYEADGRERMAEVMRTDDDWSRARESIFKAMEAGVNAALAVQPAEVSPHERAKLIEASRVEAACRLERIGRFFQDYCTAMASIRSTHSGDDVSEHKPLQGSA